MQQIPEKTERDVVELQKKLDKLEVDKAKEEEKLKEVMDSLKTETQVRAVPENNGQRGGVKGLNLFGNSLLHQIKITLNLPPNQNTLPPHSLQNFNRRPAHDLPTFISGYALRL